MYIPMLQTVVTFPLPSPCVDPVRSSYTPPARHSLVSRGPVLYLFGYSSLLNEPIRAFDLLTVLLLYPTSILAV
jgi:hypothetical protein